MASGPARCERCGRPVILATTPTGVGVVLDLAPSVRGEFELGTEQRAANVLVGTRFRRVVAQVARNVGPVRAQLGLFDGPPDPAPPRRYAPHGMTCPALERPAPRRRARG